jgi:hypothetical protein
MAWLAVDKDGDEHIYGYIPEKDGDVWALPEIKNESWCFTYNYVSLPDGTIKRLIGRVLAWEDEPVEFTEVME